MKVIDVLKSAECEIMICDSDENVICNMAAGKLKDCNLYLSKILLLSEVKKIIPCCHNSISIILGTNKEE